MEEDEEELYTEMQLEDGGRRRPSGTSHNALKVSTEFMTGYPKSGGCSLLPLCQDCFMIAFRSSLLLLSALPRSLEFGDPFLEPPDTASTVVEIELQTRKLAQALHAHSVGAASGLALNWHCRAGRRNPCRLEPCS